MRRLFAFGGLLVFSTTQALAAPTSTIGRWCGGDGNVTVIGALSLRNDDVACTFRSAKRKGSVVVTWRGDCSDAEGGSTQTVTARIKNGKLTYEFSPGGNVVGPLSRCKN